MDRIKKRKQRDRDQYRILAPEDVGRPSYQNLQRQISSLTRSSRVSHPGDLADDVLQRLRRTYLECCLQHVKAEYWGMFSNITKKMEPGWRMKECCAYVIEGDRVSAADQMCDFDGNVANYDVVIKTAKNVRKGGVLVDLIDLKGHLCIWRDNLFLTHARKLSCGCRPNGLKNRGGCSIHNDAQTWLLMRRLRPMLPDYPDPEAAKHKDHQSMLYSMGLVMSFLKTMTVIELMQRSMERRESSGGSIPRGAPNLPILDAMCHPKCTRRMQHRVFNIGGDAHSDSDAVTSPFNDKRDVELRPEQLAVIHKLKNTIELIEGPPGTGKSTMIRAIIRHSLPHGEPVATDNVPRHGQAGNNWHVYCDLDGVLANFVAGVVGLLRKHPDEFRAEGRENDMWSALAKTENFFGALDWMPGGEELWDYLKSAEAAGKISLSILSGCPKGRWSIGQKRRWCQKHLGQDMHVDLCWAADKPQFSAPGRILVDDKANYREAWEAAGGTFIYHRNAEDSMCDLRSALAELRPVSSGEEENGQTMEAKLHIEQYLVTASECDRSGYPDENQFVDDPLWVSTAGSRAVLDFEEANPCLQNLVALDCEMVETVSDPSAIARVSLVDANGLVLYDTLVKPPGKVLDFRTRFSGITEQKLLGVKVTLAEVQTQLLELLTERSIVIGHSLENDLASLKLLHKRVVDTALLYPHPNGWPSRQSLAGLCKRFLDSHIDRSKGHDSVDDARAAMQLARLKFGNGPDFGLPVRGTSVTLLLAVQNKAIDVLVRGIEPYIENDSENSKLGMLVVGSESNPNMGEVASKYVLDYLVRQNTDYQRTFIEYERLLMLSHRNDNVRALAEAKEDELRELVSIVTERIISGARIVFSTSTELFKIIHDASLRGQLCHRITSVIVDEAGTVPDYEMPLVACLPAVKRVAFIGDTKQLPPFSHLQSRCTPESFMERVQHQLGVGSDGMRRLTRQFRMTRPICKFVSDAFYDGRLLMDDIEGARRMPEFVPGGGLWLSGMYWLDYSARPPTHMLQEIIYPDARGTQIEICSIRSGCVPNECGQGHCEETRFNSVANATEIFHIISILEFFCQNGFFADGPQSKSVAVICFYKLQCEVLEASLRQSTFARSLLSAKETYGLSLRTVDSFQGNEADIVILSGVRSNTHGKVGFLASRDGMKRICVSTSRAKEALIIVADSSTLAQASEHPLAFFRLWAAQPDAGYNLRKLQSVGDLGRTNAAAAARQAEDNLFNDLFG